jgi:LmbE family N-acetylglucosaminyl deacetylase
MNKKILLLFCLHFFYEISFAQIFPKQLSASEILLEIKKLQYTGSALYLAAHPDDENTAVIAYLANERCVRTGYLSLTRGDGGQNLIGAEQKELMGLIRTQELLQARRIDGGEQFFTRANDFGFSKNAKESFEIWGKEIILADVVWIIRKFRPDIIITRFPPNREAGHGHHEASCLLAIEAFDLAGDSTKFPEQLKYVNTWQPKRLVWNAYSRGFQNEAPDSTNTISLNISNYNHLLGKSNLIIAAESRSMHKSQGFGTGKNHGFRTDFFQHLKGEKAEKDLFDGVDISWNRIPNTKKIQTLLEEVYQKFNPDKPYQSIDILLLVKKEIQNLKNNYRNIKKTPSHHFLLILEKKEEQINQIIKHCLGIWADFNANTYQISQNDTLNYQVEFSHYAPFPLAFSYQIFRNKEKMANYSAPSIPKNILHIHKEKFWIDKQSEITQPYWLKNQILKGYFDVTDYQLIGLPENEPPFYAVFEVILPNQEKFNFQIPISHKFVKIEDQEIYRPLEITPEVMVNVSETVMLFAKSDAEILKISIKAGKNKMKGKVKLVLPKGFTAQPTEIDFDLLKKDDELDQEIKIFPPKEASQGILKVLLKLENENEFQIAKNLHRIEYHHIPTQTIFSNVEVKLNKIAVKTKKQKIGYIAGAGDEIPRYLTQLGYQIIMLDKEILKKGKLNEYESIVVGVRAYNTEEHLKYEHKDLLEYVKNGGKLIIQYQTKQELKVNELGCYPFNISRERVTVEEAPITFLVPEHTILNTPNKITQEDFKNWVQERGLYFADVWSKEFTPILACNDPNEKSLEGGLLVANYGKGTFIYTGYSFFRQIPAGVSGAIRLFVNLIE